MSFKNYFMSYTTDKNDPRLGHGVDENPIDQHEVYLILSDEERAKGFVRPVRQTYVHTVCGTATTMGKALAETYAKDPKFYGATYCVGCRKHLPVDEFVWDGTKEKVGS
jgi:hypothetical protein